jgi:hypothetical protein
MNRPLATIHRVGRDLIRTMESKRIKVAFVKLVLLLLVGLPSLCQAQWLTQQVPLVAGWNAVYLEVQPEPRSCDEIFGNRPVLSVWKWDRHFSTIQFTVDPATLLPENPDWLMWLPPSDSRSFLNRLFELQGCQAYLIKVAPNTAPFTLPIKGRAIIPRLNWYPHELNLVGLPINPKHPPTFSEFFKFTSEVDTSLGYGNQLYRLDSTGRGLQIVQPARDRPQPGVAYWIACAGVPKQMSVIHVTPQGGAVDFGRFLSEQDLSIRNVHPTDTLTVRLQQRTSESPPSIGGYPELAGPVPLAYRFKNSSNTWEWAWFPTTGLSRALAHNEEWVVHLGLSRPDLAPYTPQGTNGATYQSILEVTDSAESLLIRVPVLAQKASVAGAGTLGAHSENEGLWVGQVFVNEVNAPAYTTNALLPTPAPASFRLLVHVDGYDRASLLQQVVLAWDQSLTDAQHTNGMYALYATDRTVPAQATDLNRISSVAFPPMAPMPLTGNFTNTLTGSVTIRFDDPVNPFLHRYHPLHDNKDWDFKPYANAVESRTIVRDLTLQFLPATNAAPNPMWGVGGVSGIYQETIIGLRAQPIRLQGGFALQRLSTLNTLR